MSATIPLTCVNILHSQIFCVHEKAPKILANLHCSFCDDALALKSPRGVVAAAMAVTRSGDGSNRERVLDALLSLPLSDLERVAPRNRPH